MLIDKLPLAQRKKLTASTSIKKDLGSPPGLFAKTIVVFIVSQFAAAFLIELVLALFFRGSSQVLFSQSIPAQFFFVLLAETMAFGLVYWLIKRRGLNLGSIGLGRKPQLGDVMSALSGYGVLFVLLVIATFLINLLLPNINLNQSQNLGFNNPTGGLDNVLTFIALVILPPLGEEPLVRGYLFSGLRSHWRFASAALGASLLFGIAHLEIGSGTPLVWAAGIETFILSLVLCYLRERTGALYAGVLVHMINNVLAFVVHFH